MKIKIANAFFVVCVTIILLLTVNGIAQSSDSITSITRQAGAASPINKSFIVGLEFRPRIEYRDGYKQLPTDTSSPAYFGTHRSRLLFTYSQPKFKFHTSVQDVRVWGQYGLNSTAGSLSIYEAYVETYFTDDLFLRMGRQGVELDNGRLFAVANWNQAARSHDGFNLIFKKDKIASELMTYFNQSAEKVYGTAYSLASSNYKLLNVHYLRVKLANNFTLTTINSADGNESKAKGQTETLYVRGTSGGRLEYEKKIFYATISGYYQYGQLASAQKIGAYYFQPEVRIGIKKLTIRLGAEYMSGDDATHPSQISKSFVPLYGVAWRFMGNLDYFTSFPTDVKGGGLIDPYLFIAYKANKKLSVQADGHLFYLQNKLLDAKNTEVSPYLGFENDLTLRYRINDFTSIDWGVLYMFAEKSMEILKGGNSNKIPFSSYIMITIKPELFDSKK